MDILETITNAQGGAAVRQLGAQMVGKLFGR